MILNTLTSVKTHRASRKTQIIQIIQEYKLSRNISLFGIV